MRVMETKLLSIDIFIVTGISRVNHLLNTILRIRAYLQNTDLMTSEEPSTPNNLIYF
jgi:hypothetical protein